MNHLVNANKMVSDTPRTEAEVNKPHGPLDGIVTIDADFACMLERELNAANAIIRQQQLLEQENDAANAEIERLTAKVAQLYRGAEEQIQRIKRLEEAGGVIKASLKRSLNPNEQGECKWLAELPMTDAEFAVFTTAFKAKEAKP